MKQSIVHVALVVRDYDEAIEFYTKKLHFTLVEDTYQPEQDKRWVLVAPPDSTDTTLLLAKASTPEQESFIGNQTGGRVFLFLKTDDFWRDYNEMVSVGVHFVREPKVAPYGTVAVFEDLYGNMWDLVELKERKRTMRYFAYGSNLSTRYIRTYCPSATFVMKANLSNYRVEFRHYSENRQGGLSSIIEAPGELVQGVIYEVPEEEIEELDILESVPEGLYRRDTFLVMGDDGMWHKADLYRVANPSGPYPPSKGYLEDMIEGAQEHGLEPEYIEKLVLLRRSLD